MIKKEKNLFPENTQDGKNEDCNLLVRVVNGVIISEAAVGGSLPCALIQGGSGNVIQSVKYLEDTLFAIL